MAECLPGMRIAERLSVTRMVECLSVTRMAERLPVTRMTERLPVTRMVECLSVTRMTERLPVTRMTERLLVTRMTERLPVTRMTEHPSGPRLVFFFARKPHRNGGNGTGSEGFILAKWGRRRIRFGLLRGLKLGWFPGRPWRRTKPVAWGSGRVRSSGHTSASAAKWGTRPASGKPSAAWGKKPALFTRAGRAVSKPQPLQWGTAPPGERRSRPRLRKRSLLLLVLVFMLLFSIPSFIFVERNLRPPLMNIAKVRVKQVATQAINKAITEQVARNSDSEKLIDWKMNGNGKISGFMLNYAEHMHITSETIKTVQTTLADIKNIPEHIPIGHALGSAIISSFGPRVPVKFEPVGAVKVELSTRERNAAINMVLVEVYIRVVTEVSIIIPFDTEPELVETEIPISYLLVVGDVPMYYYDSTGKPVGESAPQAPNISVPLAPGAGISSNAGEESGKDAHDAGSAGSGGAALRMETE